MEKDTTMTAGEDDSVADMYFDEDLESYRMDDVSLT